MRFWAIIAGAFAAHLVLTWLVFGVVLHKKNDVGLLITLPGILAECFILYHLVRFLDSESDRSKKNLDTFMTRGPSR
jgi:hypothetical protein